MKRNQSSAKNVYTEIYQMTAENRKCSVNFIMWIKSKCFHKFYKSNGSGKSSFPLPLSYRENQKNSFMADILWLKNVPKLNLHGPWLPIGKCSWFTHYTNEFMLHVHPWSVSIWFHNSVQLTNTPHKSINRDVLGKATQSHDEANNLFCISPKHLQKTTKN